MLKKVGLALMAIVLAALVFPLVLPKSVRVERKVSMHASPASIYAVLTDFNQFRSWDPWSMMEPESTFKVEGVGVGSVYSWEGKKTGHGTMKITEAKANEKVDVWLSFVEPFASEALTGWNLSDLGNGDTEVTWRYDQNLPYFQRYFGLTLDGMLGGQFEQGLNRLKARMEKAPG